MESEGGDNINKMSEKKIETLLKANNIISLAAIFLSSISVWFIFLAVLFWIFTLICLIRRDKKEKDISVATIAYIVMSVLLIVFLCYMMVKSITG